MPRVTVSKCVSLLLWLLILLNFTEAQEDVIKCQVRDGYNIIHLKWKKINRSLVNKHLPIWIATQSGETNFQGIPLIDYELKHNFLAENIGDFTLYHDEEKSSAIVYYHNTKLIYGIIDTRYIIRMLPRSHCELGIPLGGAYVRGYDKIETYHDFEAPLDFSIRHNEKDSASSSTSNQNEPPEEKSQIFFNSDKFDTINLYSEVLIIIPYDIVKTMKHDNSSSYITNLVEYYILYFNAVDMLYAKLSTENIKIHINLAGIVIESQNGLLNTKTCRHCIQSGRKDTLIDIENTFDVISNHLIQNRRIFPEDSYDFVFVPSRHRLCAQKPRRAFVYSGFSWAYDSYAVRKYNASYSLMMMIHHGTPNEYVVTSHELGHLMTIEHDSDECGIHYDGLQCHAIMQRVGAYCPNCLDWSERSVEDLKKYVSEKKGHCFLLNFPRSLHPYGTPNKTLSPSEQCRCYGYESLDPLRQHPDMVPETGCNEILRCDKNGERVETILPIDGTPCGHEKVCWNRQCIPRNSSTKSDPSPKPGPSGTHCHRAQ